MPNRCSVTDLSEGDASATQEHMSLRLLDNNPVLAAKK
jgi:hypothetical protein